MSQKTGAAPVQATVFAAATKLSDGETTSSPGPQPTASNARWSAAVPFETASACVAPENAANCVSSSATRGPMLHQPDSRTSRPALDRASSTATSDSGTLQVDSVTADAPRSRNFGTARLDSEELVIGDRKGAWGTIWV